MKFPNIKIRQNGFTLVELAIVITIIGILIGGVLKGQQLIEQARLAATVSQVNNYRTALSIFKTTYNELPGDMIDPDARIVGCTNCKATNSNSTPGNMMVGTGNASAPYYEKDREPIRYWLHLMKAGMISGVTDAALTSEPIGFGSTNPAAKLGGGFLALSGNGSCRNGAAIKIWSSGCLPSATVVLVLRTSFFDQGGDETLANDGYYKVFTPLQAATVDRKMDDGKAKTGDVLAAGQDSYCNEGGPGGDSYAESSTDDKVCTLGFIIDK